MRRWTRVVIRNRRKVLLAWAVVFVLGVAGAANLGDLLSNRFSVPGSEAENGLDVAKARFGEHGDGDFTLIVQAATINPTAPPMIESTRLSIRNCRTNLKRPAPNAMRFSRGASRSHRGHSAAGQSFPD